jgi:hypothetical protein
MQLPVMVQVVVAQLEDPGVMPEAPSLPPPRAAAPPLQFDRSLQELERQGAVTLRERRQVEQEGFPLRPGVAGMGGPPLRELCRTGVMSPRECARAQGAAFLGDTPAIKPRQSQFLQPKSESRPSVVSPVAAPTGETQVLVGEVVVVGLTDHPFKERLERGIHRALTVRPGSSTSHSVLKNDLAAIYATGWFTDVRMQPVDGPLGVRLGSVPWSGVNPEACDLI